MWCPKVGTYVYVGCESQRACRLSTCRAVDFPRSRNRGGNDGKSTVTRILVLFFFFFFFFFFFSGRRSK